MILQYAKLRLVLVLSAVTAFSVSAAAADLPLPTGKYAVGYKTFEFRDSSRFQENSSGRHSRIIPASIFYPAAPSAKAVRPYLPADSAALQVQSLAKNFNLDPASVEGLLTATTHSISNAPALRSKQRFPVVVFNHGLPVYPLQNTALMEELASHGYVVVTIAHPGDAVDLRLKDGRVIPTFKSAEERTPSYVAAKKQVWSAPSFDERTAAIPVFAAELAKMQLGRSVETWRRDMLFVVDAIAHDRLPAPARDAFAGADTKNIALTGMSFGGNVAAGTCHLTPYCKATFNLDGGQYDVSQFNASVGRPFLMVLSDWIGLPRPDQPSYPDFTVTDLAFEPWKKAGDNRDIFRLRVKGVRHMGLTDLMLLMKGSSRSAVVGPADAASTTMALNDLCLNFLNVYLKGAPRDTIDKSISVHPEFVRRTPATLRAWADNRP